jgi:hypothetical protein
LSRVGIPHHNRAGRPNEHPRRLQEEARPWTCSHSLLRRHILLQIVLLWRESYAADCLP